MKIFVDMRPATPTPARVRRALVNAHVDEIADVVRVAPAPPPHGAARPCPPRQIAACISTKCRNVCSGESPTAGNLRDHRSIEQPCDQLSVKSGGDNFVSLTLIHNMAVAGETKWRPPGRKCGAMRAGR
jgi:hypothetical protein